MPAAFAILAFSIFLAVSIYIAWDLNRISKHESAADFSGSIPNVVGTLGVSSIALGCVANGISYAGNSCADDGGSGGCSF
jgi:TRAP-type C4-dicarboxylate transport system permease small subunit